MAESDWVDVPMDDESDWVDVDIPTATPKAPSVAELIGQDASPLQQFGRMAIGGLSRVVPFGDEIVAGGSAGLDALLSGSPLSQAYDQRLNEVRNYQNAFAQESPVGAAVTDISGALAMPATGLVAKAPSLLKKGAVLAAEGAGMGGLYGFANAEGGAQNRIDSLLEGAESGAKWSAGIGLPLAAAGKIAGALADASPSAADKLRGRALGARASDYAKSAKRGAGVYVTDAADDTETILKQHLRQLVDEGMLEGKTDPVGLYNKNVLKSNELGREIRTIIKDVDDVRKVRLLPKYQEAERFIESAPANERGALRKSLDEWKESIRSETDGSLRFLQDQKEEIYSKVYPQGSKSIESLDKAIAKDLKRTIEKVSDSVLPADKAGAVRKLNQRLAAFEDTRPIFQRQLGTEEGTTIFDRIRQLIRTSGGFGTLGLGGAYIGGVPGAILGIGAGKLLDSAFSPKGMSSIAKGIEKGSSAFKSLPDITGKIPAITASVVSPDLRQETRKTPLAEAQSLSKGQSSTRQLLGTQLNSSPDFTSDPDLSKSRNSAYASAYKRSSFMDTVLDRAEGRSMDKAPVAIIEEQIDADPYYSALYEAESGRNPLAKNPTSSATGGFQFIKRTAQSLGLDDPTDLGKSFEAVQKLTKEIDAVANGDPFLRYAGHYLGAPLLKKWLEKKSLSDTEEEQVRYLKAKALPRFQKIYKRIAQKKAGVLEA